MNDFLVPLDVKPWFMQLVKFTIFKSDLDAQIIFIYTYCQYATSEELFLAAEDVYLTTGFDKSKLAKLVEFLYLWLNKEENFDRKLRRKVLDLARLYAPANGEGAVVGKQAKRFWLPTISLAYQKLLDSGALSPREHSDSLPLSSPSLSPRGLESRHSISLTKLTDPYNLDILKYSSSAIAKQLTLIDYQLTFGVSMTELRDKILKPGAGKYQSVAEISDRFNQISFWVATQVVVAPTTKIRVDIIEKFIAVAKKLLKYKNFLGVFQILSGLHNTSIRRLKTCWQNVSQKSNMALVKMEQIMSHNGNYSQYRACIRECQQKSIPAVPLICLLLQDLTFINDGNDNETTDGKVNFEKWHMFGSCLLGFSKLMENRYTFQKNSAVKKMLMHDLLVLPETLIMKHSYAIETRKRFPLHGTTF